MRGARTLRGYFGQPQEPKYEKWFSPISSDLFIRRITQVKNSGIYLFCYACYGNKNGPQNRLEIEKSPFWTKFKAFGDFF